MPFPYSLIWQLKLETTEVGHCNLSLCNFFEQFWITNSHVFLRELVFVIEKACSQQFSFEITLLDRFYHLTVLPKLAH